MPGDYPVAPGSNNAPKLLVLGPHGFIGSHLVGAGHRTGMRVLGFSLDADLAKGERILRSLDTPQIPAVAGDATDRNQIREVLERYRPDVVINAAGRVGPTSDPAGWLGDYSVNYLTATATVDALAMIDPERRPYLLWIGSQDEYGLAPGPWDESVEAIPTSAYGTSKLLATTIVTSAVRTGIVEGCVVRLPYVFGEAQAPALVVSRFVVAALQGEPLPTLPGNPSFVIAYAPDVAEWMIRLASAHDAASFPPVINAPGYQPISQHNLVGLIDSLVPGGVVAEPTHPEWSTGPSYAWPDTTLVETIGMGPVLETPLDYALGRTLGWYDRNRWFWTVG